MSKKNNMKDKYKEAIVKSDTHKTLEDAKDVNLLNIKPCDYTFFRDGRQFDFGINDFIESKNVPYSSVFFGAIFSAMLGINDAFRKAFFNDIKRNEKDESKIMNPEDILEIGQVYLYNEASGEAYINAPKDLFIDSRQRVSFGKFEKLPESIEGKAMTSLNYSYKLKSPSNKDFKRVKKHYINLKNLTDAYIKKQSSRIEIKNEDEIFKKNVKVGIGIDKNSRTVEKDKLYKVQQTEFVNNNWSFIVEYKFKKDLGTGSSIKLSEGYLKLGGEGKVCKYKDITKGTNLINSYINEFNKNKEIIVEDESKVKVILTSDTYIKFGDLNKTLEDIGVLGVSNDKPIYIGGYSMQSNSKETKGPRKMHKGYSAGTVFLLDRRKLNSLLKVLDLKSGRGFNKYIVVEDM